MGGIYVRYIEVILLKYLSQQTGYTRTLTKRKWWELLGIVNSKYSRVSSKELEDLDYSVTAWEIKNFYQRCNKKLEEILFSALNSLKSRKLITYEIQTIIVKRDDKGREIYSEANDNEKKMLLDVEHYVLHNIFECDKMIQIFLRFQQKDFYNKVNELLYEYYGWDHCFKQIKIIYTPDGVRQVYPELEAKLQQELSLMLNEEVCNAINQNAKDTYQKWIDDHKKWEQSCWRDILNSDGKRTSRAGYVLVKIWELKQYELFMLFRIRNAIQCCTERFEDNADLAAFRNPHNSPNNILHFHNIRADLIAKYFPKLGQNVIIINLIGTDAQARGSGFDEDSDFVLVTDQSELASLAKDAYVKYPTIINKVEELKSSEYHFRLEDYAEMDSKIADAQASIGTSTDAAQLALSYYYDDGMKNRELEEVFIILSVIGQISIDLAKKEFNLNVGREIKRIRNLSCMNKKFVPQFFADTKKRRNNKDFENVKRMNCPMDIMAEMIEQQTGYSERVSHVLIRELFNKKIKGKANKYKFNKLIEESKKYNNAVKILSASKRKGRLEDDELYKLKRRQMELFLRKTTKNLDQITIMQLVNHALMDSNSDVMGTILNFLYSNYREKFLNCFVENS